MLLSLVMAFPAAGCLGATASQGAPIAADPQGPVPVRADVLFYEEDAARFPFGGARERWQRDAIPQPPLPIAFGAQPQAADVRADVVDVGVGAEADFERLATLRIQVEGAILLIEPSGSEQPTWTAAADLADRAKEAGAVGILIVTTEPRFVARAQAASGRLALPVIPLRPDEAAQLRERLRAKRVRGADGQAKTVKLGPGPVEAHILVEGDPAGR